MRRCRSILRKSLVDYAEKRDQIKNVQKRQPKTCDVWYNMYKSIFEIFSEIRKGMVNAYEYYYNDWS